jgi:hypothetical protein
MKSLLFAFVVAFLIGCSDSNDANEVGLQVSLDRYFNALRPGEQRITIDMMDPRFFPNPTAKAQAIAMLENSTTTMKYHSITNGKPFGHFTESNSVDCFVPYVCDAELQGQRGTLKSYLLATRYHSKPSWFFIDIGTKTRETLAPYYENLPKELPKASRE